MAKTGLQNEELLKKIQQKGSNGLVGKNEFGVNQFNKITNNDGVISGKLVKGNYNIEELQKSIDTVITELIPNEVPQGPDVVLRSIYEESLERVDELSLEVQTLQSQIAGLESTIQDLRTVSQSLRVDLDSKELITAAAENESEQTSNRIETIISDLQNSIQRATSETIKRTSLEARNLALKEEVDSLAEQLYGKQSEIEAGAQAVGGLITVNIEPKNIRDDRPQDIFARRARNDLNRFDWVHGKQLTILNTSETVVTVSFKRGNRFTNWIRIPSPRQVQPNEKIVIELQADLSPRDFDEADSTRRRDDGEYKGTFFIVAENATGEKREKSLSTNFEKYKYSS